MVIRISAIAIACLGAVFGLVDRGPYADAAGPTPVANGVLWPFALDTLAGAGAIKGESRFNVTTENGSVTAVTTVGTPTAATRFAEAAIRSWRFENEPRLEFQTVLRHVVDGASGCDQDINQVVRSRLPEFIEVVSTALTVCDPTVVTTILPDSLSGLAGVVRCNCAGARVVVGAILSVRSLADRSVRRNVRTDQAGAFRLVGLPPGHYEVRVSADDFRPRNYRFTISPDGLKNISSLVLDEAERINPPSTLVVAGAIPSYPVAARGAGRSGVVDLRLSMKGDEVIDIDAMTNDSDLAAAAIANLQTWHFRATSVSVLSVRFDYRLKSGRCDITSPTAVEMRLPAEIVVESVSACHPSEVRQLMMFEKSLRPIVPLQRND